MQSLPQCCSNRFTSLRIVWMMFDMRSVKMIPGEYTANKNKIALASLAEKHLKKFSPLASRAGKRPKIIFLHHQYTKPVHKSGLCISPILNPNFPGLIHGSSDLCTGHGSRTYARGGGRYEKCENNVLTSFKGMPHRHRRWRLYTTPKGARCVWQHPCAIS